MSDFLDGLERDLVDAMRRHEARPHQLGRALPRFELRRLRAAVALAAACALAVTVALPALRGVSDEERVLTPAEQAPVALPDGSYSSKGKSVQLLVTGSRYTLLRCEAGDCGFDIGPSGQLSGTKVRTGRLERRGGVATFSSDLTCVRDGTPIRGVYRVTRERAGVVFERISDACAARAAALARSRWTSGP